MATNAAGRVATRAVVTTATGEEQDGKQHDQDEGDDPEHLHPAWYAGGRSAVGLHAGVGVRGRVSDVANR